MFFDPTSSRILYVNHGATVLLGGSSDELVRMAPADFMAEHDAEAFHEVLAPLLDGSQPHILLETKFRRKDPSAVDIDVSLQLIRIAADRVVAIARDITERKHTQLERELLYREAVDAIRARDEFLSVASHELRTPLSALQLQIQMLLQTSRASPDPALSPEQLKAKLETAQRQIERVTRLIGELMDVSRITTGLFRVELEEIDLAAVVRDVVDRLGEVARRTHSPIAVSAPTPVVGMWDRMRVEQVVTDLLTNALKFGGGKPIEVAVEERGPTGRLVVVDHGIGIARQDVERIFDRYQQAISWRAFGGLGLGLYIVRQIVEGHGGTIGIESQPLFRAAELRAERNPLHCAAVATTRRRVLVVEDDAQLAHLYCTSLALRGIAPIRAADGMAALRAIEQHRPDLILLDLMLPAVSGWTIVRELTANPLTSDIPIIVVTGVEPAPDIPGFCPNRVILIRSRAS